MLTEMLPLGVQSEELFGRPSQGGLLPEEATYIAGAVEERRLEYAAVRRCARASLRRLGVQEVAILSGERGQPLWPANVRGSLTHCPGYMAAAVAPSALVDAMGIDAEPDVELPGEVLEVITTENEIRRLPDPSLAGDDPSWGTLLFSAKESVYKAWSPAVGTWLDHQAVEIRLDPDGWFSAMLPEPGLAASGGVVTRLRGRWARGQGILVTVVLLPAKSLILSGQR